ncbi:retrovirus-related Pol polyprotein from transposon opus [Trichonephila clavipes]|nr:retrovirus-related Pol polyprotein from transposon opus [Trichonephila clavipes]
MAFLGKAKKQDLVLLAEELGQKVSDKMTIIDLKNIIIGSKDYEEEFVRAQLSVISEKRVERETEEKIARQLRWESELNELRLQIESIRSNVKRTSCAEDRKNTSSNYRISIGRAGEHMRETSSAVLMAEATIPVTTPIKEENGTDDLRVVYVKVKGEQEMANAVMDTGAQMPVVRADVVEGQSVDSGGTIQIMSAFGEREVTELKIFNLKIDDSRHGVVPIMCAVSKRLVNDMLVCSSAYEALLENVQFIHNPANSYVSSRAVEGITADDPKSISSQEMTRETYPSEIYIQSVSIANAEEQLPEGRETRSTFIKMQREDDTLKKLWSLAEKQKNSVKIHNGILVHSEYICGENIDQVM